MLRIRNKQQAVTSNKHNILGGARPQARTMFRGTGNRQQATCDKAQAEIDILGGARPQARCAVMSH